MSSPITPAGGPSVPPRPAEPTSSAVSACTGVDAFGAELATNLRALQADASAGPPPEVLDQIEAAGRISRHLDESGHAVRFGGRAGERIAVELQDREGNIVRKMSISEALELAAGRGLE